MSHRSRGSQKLLPKSSSSSISRKESLRHGNFEDDNHKIRRTKPGPGLLYWQYIFLFAILWLMVIHYYERSVVKRVIRRCEWSRWDQWPQGTPYHKVGLFADPQIMDAHSYPGRPHLVNTITRLVLDNYHKKNWKYIQYYLDPDTNFFLGDLFDGGRYWEDDYWHEEYRRFQEIFPKKPRRKTVMSIPGNHDIGFGDTIIESSLKRFSTYFGETSSYMDIGNHTLVLLDTISLSDKVNPNISKVPKEFLEHFSKVPHSFPRILLSHVPLWRDPKSQQCGPLRESRKAFPLMSGVQYQTVIDADISQDVLARVKPDLLFSGDDHDYCRISHSYKADGTIRSAEEITVKSCAMNMGIKKPAIQLLTLHNPSHLAKDKTYQTNICYLPDPYKPFKMYLLTLLATLATFVAIHFTPKTFNKLIVYRLEKTFHRPSPTSSSLPLPVSTALSPNMLLDSSKYRVSEIISVKRFVANAMVMTTVILALFTLYYMSI